MPPGGCSPRSRHCVTRCQGKSDSWSLMAPQAQGGWGLPGVSSGAALEDLHQVTVSGAQAQGEDKHLLWRWFKSLRCLYHHEMGDLNYSRSAPYCVALAAPQTLLEKSGWGENLSWSHHRAQRSTSPSLPCQQCSCRDNRAPFQPSLALLTSPGWRGDVCVQTLQATTGVQSCSCLAFPSGKSLI